MKCPRCGGTLEALYSVTGWMAVPMDEHGHLDWNNNRNENENEEFDYISCKDCGARYHGEFSSYTDGPEDQNADCEMEQGGGFIVLGDGWPGNEHALKPQLDA